MRRRTIVPVTLGLAAAALTACAHAGGDGRGVARNMGSAAQQQQGLFSVARGRSGGGEVIGVNAFLWRASLDTLAFMPLASADPFGGVIITDWYTNPEKPDERFKATVYILDTRLRADGLNVTVFKQTRGPNGQWVDASVAGQTDVDIENAILTRARQLRLSTLGGRG